MGSPKPSKVLSPSPAFGPRARLFFPLLLTFAASLLIVSLDRYSRVRAVYRRAEALELLARRPAERDKALEAAFLAGVDALDRRRPAPAQREAGVEVLRKRWEQDRLRSAWADAYHAWRDVSDFYAPPEGRWTRRARLLAPAARQRWREEWTECGLPFQESLLDLVPGEDEGFRWVGTFPDKRELSQVMSLLADLGIPFRSVSPPGGAPGLAVPEAHFWEAHQALRPLAGLGPE